MAHKMAESFFPVQLLGRASAFELAELFLTETYNVLTKLGLRLPPVVPFTERDPELSEGFFLTEPPANHSVDYIIFRDPSDEFYETNVLTNVIMHDLDYYQSSGWQAARNLSIIVKEEQRDLFKLLVEAINSSFVVDTPNGLERYNLNGIWNIRVTGVSVDTFDPEVEFRGGTVGGVALRFRYTVIILDEREYVPPSPVTGKMTSRPLRTKGKGFAGR